MRSLYAAIALCAVLASTAANAGDVAQDWIQRMNKALDTRNYEGVLVRQTGKRREVLRIVHRKQDGLMSERVTVVSDGPRQGLEFHRKGKNWVLYNPEQRVAVTQTRNRSYGFLIALNGVRQNTSRYYEFTDGGAVRIDGRDAQLVSLKPRDNLRYGYRFWLDARTALPLKTQLFSGSGEVLDEVTFLSITLPEKIDDERLKPDFDTSRFRKYDNDVPMYTPGLGKVFVPRRELLPAGFYTWLIGSREEQAKAPGPRSRFFVTDDIGWVSVVVEVDKRGAEAKDPPASNGAKGGKAGAASGTQPDDVVMMDATAIYTARVDGFKITAVGEVPPATVKAIAEALRPE